MTDIAAIVRTGFLFSCWWGQDYSCHCLLSRASSFRSIRVGQWPLASWRFVIFWSGLRGARSLALVLALPLEVPARDALVFSTYAVVLFTLLVQRTS